jgi:hypothetical protein
VNKICLFGNHAKRTPFAYPEYRKLFQKHFEYTQNPGEADFLISGFLKDFRDNAGEIERICSINPDIKLVVLSEEPLWDTVWSGNFFAKYAEMCVGDYNLPYTALNHCTTKIYDFEKFPYFLTTNDDFFARYANLFSRNRKYTTSEIRSIWKNASIKAAFYAESRQDVKYNITFPDQDIVGLCTYRTEVAKEIQGDGVLRVGQGWGTSSKRQSLPDWHLDKLAALDRNSFLVSGLENTHQRQYVTEKIFDAFAVLAIPLYYASPLHSITRLLPKGTYINLFGLFVNEAIEKIASFQPDIEFIEHYSEAQSCLAETFSNPSIYIRERRRVVAEVVFEFQSLIAKAR